MKVWGMGIVGAGNERVGAWGLWGHWAVNGDGLKGRE